MPTEMRRLIFSQEEVFEALRLFCTKAGQSFPKAQGLEMNFRMSPNITLELQNESREIVRSFN